MHARWCVTLSELAPKGLYPIMYNCAWAKDNLGKEMFLGASVTGYIGGNRCEYIHRKLGPGTWRRPMGLCKRRTYAYERLLYVWLPHNQVEQKVNVVWELCGSLPLPIRVGQPIYSAVICDHVALVSSMTTMISLSVQHWTAPKNTWDTRPRLATDSSLCFEESIYLPISHLPRITLVSSCYPYSLSNSAYNLFPNISDRDDVDCRSSSRGPIPLT